MFWNICKLVASRKLLWLILMFLNGDWAKTTKTDFLHSLTQTVFWFWYLYLSVVFHYKYQSYKYERNTAVHMPHGSFSRATVKRWTTWEITWQFVPQFQVLGHLCKTLPCPLILYFVLCTLATTLRHRALEPAASPGRHPQLCETISRWRSHFQLFTWSFSFLFF